jgi:hypothetical protein
MVRALVEVPPLVGFLLECGCHLRAPMPQPLRPVLPDICQQGAYPKISVGFEDLLVDDEDLERAHARRAQALGPPDGRGVDGGRGCGAFARIGGALCVMYRNSWKLYRSLIEALCGAN